MNYETLKRRLKETTRVKNAADDVIIAVTQTYVNNEFWTLEDLRVRFGHSREFYSNLMYRGIKECILSDELTSRVTGKLINFADPAGRRRNARKCNEAKAERERFQKELEHEQRIQETKEQLVFYQNLLSSYDDYSISDDEAAPSKAEIENKIFELSLAVA